MFGPAGRCRFTPSCSEYAIDALRRHGAVAGTWLAVRRVARCHPWGGCGDDPVPEPKPEVHSHPTLELGLLTLDPRTPPQPR
ncbi:MAG TPA: membrane protein insertion efficiency factor YidD [Candidatus Paceibacterota bacterium]|nr:membrane protein insertion efficiency factor YidD [Candidatus Paceibacterota bacterium]